MLVYLKANNVGIIILLMFKISKLKKLLPKLHIFYIFLIALTLLAVFLKVVKTEKKEIFVKIKVSPGFWWASTSKPLVWFPDSIKKGDKEKDLAGKIDAEVLEVRHYPYQAKLDGVDYITQYEIFVKAKVKVDYNERKNQFIFKRSPLAVGAPIEIELPQVSLSGTVIEIDESENKDTYLEKEITLVYEDYAFYENELVYGGIKIGETYFDGEDIVFTIKDKKLQKMSFGNPSVPRMAIVVQAKIKVKEKSNQFLFGEEKIISVGSDFFLPMQEFIFSNFIITSIK